MTSLIVKEGAISSRLVVRSVIASIVNLQVNWSGVCLPVDGISSLIINFSHLEGVSVSAKQLKDIVVLIP